MTISITISNADDLAGIAGETARHNKNFGTSLTPQQFFETIFVANGLRSWKHDHVNQDVQALKDRLQLAEAERAAAVQAQAIAESEKGAAEHRAAKAEEKAAALKAAPEGEK